MLHLLAFAFVVTGLLPVSCSDKPNRRQSSNDVDTDSQSPSQGFHLTAPTLRVLETPTKAAFGITSPRVACPNCYGHLASGHAVFALPTVDPRFSGAIVITTHQQLLKSHLESHEEAMLVANTLVSGSQDTNAQPLTAYWSFASIIKPGCDRNYLSGYESCLRLISAVNGVETFLKQSGSDEYLPADELHSGKVTIKETSSQAPATFILDRGFGLTTFYTKCDGNDSEKQGAYCGDKTVDNGRDQTIEIVRNQEAVMLKVNGQLIALPHASGEVTLKSDQKGVIRIEPGQPFLGQNTHIGIGLEGVRFTKSPSGTCQYHHLINDLSEFPLPPGTTIPNANQFVAKCRDFEHRQLYQRFGNEGELGYHLVAEAFDGRLLWYARPSGDNKWQLLRPKSINGDQFETLTLTFVSDTAQSILPPSLMTLTEIMHSDGTKIIHDEQPPRICAGDSANVSISIGSVVTQYAEEVLDSFGNVTCFGSGYLQSNNTNAVPYGAVHWTWLYEDGRVQLACKGTCTASGLQPGAYKLFERTFTTINGMKLTKTETTSMGTTIYNWATATYSALKGTVTYPNGEVVAFDNKSGAEQELKLNFGPNLSSTLVSRWNALGYGFANFSDQYGQSSINVNQLSTTISKFSGSTPLTVLQMTNVCDAGSGITRPERCEVNEVTWNGMGLSKIQELDGSTRFTLPQ